MRKNYILDTNILIYDPQSIFSFEDNNLYIPIYVLEELDKLKNEQSLRGRNSREAYRLIDGLRCSGHLAEGVDINDGGKLKIGRASCSEIRKNTLYGKYIINIK